MIRPINHQILIKMLAAQETKTKGGIILSNVNTDIESSGRGHVVGLGELAYKIHKDLNIEAPVKLGDLVRFQQYQGAEVFEVDEDNELVVYRLMKDSDVLGVYEPEVNDE